MSSTKNLNRKQRRAQAKKDGSNGYITSIQNKWQSFEVLAPEKKPSSHGKIQVILDDNNYPELLCALEQCGENPISEETYNTKRDEYHKSIKEVMTSIGKIVYKESAREDILVSRPICLGRYQIDCYAAVVQNQKKKKTTIARYDFSIILNYEKFPFAYYPIKITANQKGNVTHIEEKSYSEISKEAEALCQILAVSSWSISYWALEPKKGETFIYPEVPIPEIPKGWYQ